jgi:hypothetical protein
MAYKYELPCSFSFQIFIQSFTMARRKAKKSTVAESKTQRGKKKLEGSTSVSRRINDPKKVKLKNIPLPSDSSSSDDIDEDYAEFLKTYDPQESYPCDCASGEDDGSQVTVESKDKSPKSSKASN